MMSVADKSGKMSENVIFNMSEKPQMSWLVLAFLLLLFASFSQIKFNERMTRNGRTFVCYITSSIIKNTSSFFLYMAVF